MVDYKNKYYYLLKVKISKQIKKLQTSLLVQNSTFNVRYKSVA